MVIVAAIFSIINGNVDQVVGNIPLNAKKAFDLSLSMVGVMAFWLGLMKIAEDSGVTNILVSLLKPIMTRVFPEIPPNHPAMGSILLSMASNILGLNNAATPISIRAMQAMQKLNNNPATATVVNFGVSFLHLSDTENTEKPMEDVIPKRNPIKEFFSVFPIAIITIPTVAIMIETQTFKDIFSFKNIKANNAVKKGIAAKHKSVIAALVFVIE